MALNAKQRQDHSINWYRKMITGFVANARTLESENIGKLVPRPVLGRVTFFFYDPKLKAVLPYYDKFPVIIPLNYYNDGFLGLNLHYLPEGARMAFFEELLGTQNNYYVSMRTYMGYNTGTRLTVGYPDLKNAANFEPYKVCIKRYLYSHVRSVFLDINPPNWHLAVSLPVQRFSKGSPY